jgi:glycosyltransferase involved in cell wall biosynthesis
MIARLRVRASVLITNYNYGRFLRQCILSAKAQASDDLEIVVVDDGSTDQSLEILAEFEHQIKVVRQPNRGQHSAILSGLTACSGQYIFLLDSDDFWSPDHCSSVMQAIERHHAPDIVIAGLTIVDDQGKNPKSYSRPVDVDYGYSYLISRFSFRWLGNFTSTIVLKRVVLAEILARCSSLASRSVLDPNDAIVVGADLLGFRKVVLSKPSVFRRMHADSMSTGTALSKQRSYEQRMLRCMLFSFFNDFEASNPYLHSGMSFAAEFATKVNVPLAEALLYARAALLHGKSRRLRQVWQIFSHWRSTGTTQHPLFRLALKSRSCG